MYCWTKNRSVLTKMLNVVNYFQLLLEELVPLSSSKLYNHLCNVKQLMKVLSYHACNRWLQLLLCFSIRPGAHELKVWGITQLNKFYLINAVMYKSPQSLPNLNCRYWRAQWNQVKLLPVLYTKTNFHYLVKRIFTILQVRDEGLVKIYFQSSLI